jgi:hypothetical protein
MASWKLKGVVPDSDDEESLDNEIDASDGELGEGSRNNQHQDHDENAKEEKGSLLEHVSTEKHGFQSSSPTEDDHTIGDLDAHTARFLNQNTDGRRLLHSSSPASPQIFRAPRALWDLDHDLTDSENEATESTQTLPAFNPLPPADEVSKTYVRLTSPMSSLLSSPPGSQQEAMSDLQSKSTIDGESHSSRIPLNTLNDSPIADTKSHTIREPANSYRRALRERAPIQLHPYAMEQEKYRRTLKARGMTPMRLAQAQDENHRRKHVPSSDPTSQDLESQEREAETEESQPMDFNWDLNTFPSVENNESQASEGEKSDDSSSIDDDEFPDISELIQGQQPRSGRLKPKRRHRLSQKPSQATKPAKYVPKVNEVFEVPASPPATSSPFTTNVRSARRTVSQAASLPSKEPTPSWLDQDELNVQSAPDLPTPVTSAIKPVSDPIFVESDLDEDDPFASELNDSVSCSSSSDESIEIRKVSKKIRGVLPASHLRLDQQLKKLGHPVATQRDSSTVSPVKPSVRRGVALPRASGAAQLAHPSMKNALPFLSDPSDDEVSDHIGLSVEDDTAENLVTDFAQSRMGYAEEEDRIDAMLPSLKRQRKFATNTKKKMRLGSTSLPAGHSHQPKITQHVVRGPSSLGSRRTRSGKATRKTGRGAPDRRRNPKPPRLSILDVVDLTSHPEEEVPQFIKVAARTARSKIAQGRQSPSGKFIRLASREDTIDAQSVLEEWKASRIMPRNLGTSAMGSNMVPRPPLGRIPDNNQTKFPPPMAKTKSRFQVTGTRYGRIDRPRQLVVSRGRQMSIKDYASTQQPMLPCQYSITHPGPKAISQLPQRRVAIPRHRAPQSRPAQLENSEMAYSSQNPGAAFTTAKKSLDGLFRLHRKHPVNLHLNRFLFDEDIVRPSPDAALVPEPEASDLGSVRLELTGALPKPRKRLPQRIDAGAARYRQPSEPAVLDAPSPEDYQESAGQDNKLKGLAKLGTRYPIHFDIFPLQSGIFFHESTFIGSGRLSQALNAPAATPFGESRGHSFFRLRDKDFRWGQWNEDVSSEVGLFFDCLVELLTQCPTSSNPSVPSAAASIEFLIDYVQHHVCFASSENRQGFLSRMLETTQEFSSRVSGIELPSEEKKSQCWIDTMARYAILMLQLLHISRTVQAATTSPLEDVLKVVACICTRLLVRQGLGSVRKLYDDLQYLSFRERGIRSDQYIALSWVTILRVLDVARIPKGSFWDVTNMALTEGDVNMVGDARVMEQIWYSMFTLLPLCEFDEFGVVVSGRRHGILFDNWAVPQRMLRKVFALYSADSKQSPGFNDYCRTLVSRCHHLIHQWGWWRSGGLIGTVFDFFASRKLEHLRNEEVYKSPRFLEELDAEPPLDVEPEDRCFHIFLKIVALTIKHLRHAKDDRSIRNLVARLLPNHDRQYPKDEEILQRDLAALRNHHDLLCTLYWASPPDCRPTLSLIQDLVIPDRSHKEACLINLRALDNLARYVFTSPADETAVYQQFTRWELAFFESLLHQYLITSSDFRKQAALLSDSLQQPIMEAQLQKAIISYRQATRAVIETQLSNLRDRITDAKDAEAALSCLNAGTFTIPFHLVSRQYLGMSKQHVLTFSRAFVKDIESRNLWGLSRC